MVDRHHSILGKAAWGQEYGPEVHRRKATPRKALALVGVVALAWIPLRLGWTRCRYPEPQALFVLGGHLSRFHHALKMAAQPPYLPIVVSSGIRDQQARQLAREAGIDVERLVIDHQAVDTVTNFTRLLDEMRRRGFRHVYLVTSDRHMRRAHIVAVIVFGSRGIVVTPVAVPSRHLSAPEPWPRVARDGLRAVVWLVSGWDGQRLPLTADNGYRLGN